MKDHSGHCCFLLYAAELALETIRSHSFYTQAVIATPIQAALKHAHSAKTDKKTYFCTLCPITTIIRPTFW